MKKHNVFRALITSAIFTYLYAFMLNADLGPGIQNSLVANLDIRSIFTLAFTIGVGYIISICIIGFLCSLFINFIDKEDDFYDAIMHHIAICCKSAAIIAFLSIALGFVSWGNF